MADFLKLVFETLREQSITRANELAADNADRLIERIDRICQSPIEKAFLVELYWQFHTGYLGELRIYDPSQDEERCIDGAFRFLETCIELGGQQDAHQIIVPQCRFKSYRLDFFLAFQVFEKRYGMVIECDGHDFHDRTKEQATSDRARDRAVQSVGLPIYRFTGSDIYNNADKCGDEVFSFIENARELELNK